jgi:hypothetical protein
VINVVICTAIALRLMLSSKTGRTHKRGVAWIAANLFLFYGNFGLLWLFGHYKASAWQATAVNLSKWRRSKYKYSIDLQRLLHILPMKGRAQNTLVASNMKNHTLA